MALVTEKWPVKDPETQVRMRVVGPGQLDRIAGGDHHRPAKVDEDRAGVGRAHLDHLSKIVLTHLGPCGRVGEQLASIRDAVISAATICLQVHPWWTSWRHVHVAARGLASGIRTVWFDYVRYVL